MLDDYLKGIFKTAKQADATEPSYYPALKVLLEAFADSSGHAKAHVTVLPKKTEAGNPDFRVWDGKQHVVGYVEAKAPTQENLEVIETSDQLKRYLESWRGRIFTFVNKRLRLRIKIDDAMTDAEPPLRFLKNSFAAHKAVRNLSRSECRMAIKSYPHDLDCHRNYPRRKLTPSGPFYRDGSPG